jgi:GDP-L-fucose synthase
MEKQSKIYVAGHTGMVGSAIVRRLIAEGYNNLLFTPFPQYDLTNQSVVAEFFKKEKPEYVFLAAARVGGIMANNNYRAQFIYDNIMIQSNVIHQSYLSGVLKLLFLGSSCVYPRECPQPIKEEYLLTGELEYTNEPYAVAKISGLKMCEAYNYQYGTNFISVMPTNLYGPNDNYDLDTSHVLPALVRKLHIAKCLEDGNWAAIRNDLMSRPIKGLGFGTSEREITDKLVNYGFRVIRNQNSPEYKVTIRLWGSGKPLREFLFVDDLADACIFLMENYENTDQGEIDSRNEKMSLSIRNKHINIGTGQDISIMELAERIRNILGFSGTIEWDSGFPDGTMQKLLNIDRIRNMGWKPKVDLETGLKYICESLKS